MRIVVKPSRSQQPSTSFLNSGVQEKKLLKGTLGFGFILLVFLVVMPLAAIILGAHQSPLPVWLLEVGGWARGGLEDGLVTSNNGPKDKLLGGLLPAGFHEGSCLSRYQSASYRTASSHLPSRYLSRRLRKYEAFHKRCGPNTELYNKTIEQLKDLHNNRTTGCNYVVWIPFSGLGNRMLTLASAFLYALLTNRVLLIHTDASMKDLFCEPFPHTSWLLPSDFPMKGFPKFSQTNPRCYGKMLRRKAATNYSSDDAAKQRLPAHVYLYLFHDYDDFDMHFFCEEDQQFLRKIPWLVIGSDNYFAPSLFSIPSFEEELSRLFPKRDTVFHHLGRYLFHPTNTVWGMITRYYQAYLAKAKERVGIQIRIFNRGSPFMHISDQILACSLREDLLPDINLKEPIVSTTNKVISKAVLVTCLHSEVYEKIKTMFYEYPTVTGEIIGVYQPSHEEVQQTKEEMHNKKAWAEIYLLSLTDVLVTSAWSTFGYVAQGLGGLKPWILIRSENMTMPDPPCRRALSMDPCFHNPPTFSCNGRRDDEVLVSHLRHCEDMSSGVKLVHEA